ncbi:MAG: FHA domain-containing protein [Propionibacteriaceae bacterium]|jgi:Na+-transporting methylmalonyl-CoA/oxaloacetate decarboxylase gamma subunit|nr:FHA domain-containing protein [Propionibacteriaceae bacterium]
MGAFAVLTFKIGFLVLLWLFILVIALVIRTDMVGRRVKAPRPAPQVERAAAATPRAERAGRPGRAGGAPTKRRPGQVNVVAIDSGVLAGQRLQLVDDVRIGRSADCELYLDDEYVTSKHPHARLTRQGDGSWLLTDLGSTNGTYVNGARITGPRIVTPADRVQIGRTQLRLES